MEIPKLPQNKLESPEYIERFLGAYSEALEEMVTEPRAPFDADELRQVSEFKESGKKLHKTNRWFYDKFVRVAQDFRFSPDEIDILSERYFE